jgi:hypothetical protein
MVVMVVVMVVGVGGGVATGRLEGALSTRKAAIHAPESNRYQSAAALRAVTVTIWFGNALPMTG